MRNYGTIGGMVSREDTRQMIMVLKAIEEAEREIELDLKPIKKKNRMTRLEKQSMYGGV